MCYINLNALEYTRRLSMPKSKNKALGILALAGVEPYQEKAGEEYMKSHNKSILKRF